MENILLDNNLAQILIGGTKKIFKNYFKTQVSEQDFYFDQGFKNSGDISGLVTLKQNNKEGIFVITFPMNTIQNMLESIYGRVPEPNSKELREGVGELTNIAYGIAKKDLNELGHNLGMSIPTIIVGNDHMIHPFSSGQSLVIPFTSEKGNFCIQVILENFINKD